LIDNAKSGSMPRVTASAPGKLVLLGEYAVLEGAPAVVMAVNRRASATLLEHKDGIMIDAPSLGIPSARGRVTGHGSVDWLGAASTIAGKLGLAGAVIAAEAGADARLHAVLDTDAFFHGPDKLGLGSSAALTVALAGAIRTAKGEATPDARGLIELHRSCQGGRGSGLDIAASLAGGAIVYRLRDGQPHSEAIKLPAGLDITCVWSGRSASTGDFLQRVAAWRDAEPRRHAVVMNNLKSCASAGAMAMQCNDTATVLEAAATYARDLAELGRASGANIVSVEHVKIGTVAKACGVVYKTCGAGGGDIGVGLSTDADRLSYFRRRLEAAGFNTLDLGLDPMGLSATD
jgi:phosphomevalonate kinase